MTRPDSDAVNTHPPDREVETQPELQSACHLLRSSESRLGFDRGKPEPNRLAYAIATSNSFGDSRRVSNLYRRLRVLRAQGRYRDRDEIDRVAAVIKATHSDFRYQPIAGFSSPGSLSGFDRSNSQGASRLAKR
jgi:hypothetical protein